jgi:U5 small nuclear ribonucleoprotein component
MDTRPLLKVVSEAFFGPSVGLVDMITKFIPSPVEAAEEKVSLVAKARGGETDKK